MEFLKKAKTCAFFFFFIFIFNIYSHEINELIDLEDMAQDIVLQTKQIILSDYPHAFNPSIIRWNGSLLMSFRVIPNTAQVFNTWIGLVWLDENFEPINKPQQLQLRNPNSAVPSRAEDGRLIAIGEHLYLVYTDNEDPIISRGGFRMYICEILIDGQNFIAKNIERISSFEGNNQNRREKNWVPFVYKNNLLLAYTLTPHKILQPIFGTGHCETYVSSDVAIDWQWGELRGGTQGLLDGDKYLAFFHSSKKMITANSKGKEAMHYFMGAYTYSAHPPFNITGISKEPIIGKKFYNGVEYKPYWGSVRVVFPCGYICDENYFWVTYGRQDHELWVAKLDKKKVYENLIPCT